MGEVRHLLSSLQIHADRAAQQYWEKLPLPSEIINHIADYLGLESVMQARLVSRKWYQRFFNFDACVNIVKRHFPRYVRWKSDIVTGESYS